MEYTFHFFNSLASLGSERALQNLLGDCSTPPVVACIGSDLAIGDCLGPIVGTMLSSKIQAKSAFIYGTLRRPITAKEIKYLGRFLKKTHPNSKIIAIDAAVGDSSELGLIKYSNSPLQPGAGANKRLGEVGDISILGIVAEKANFSFSKLNLTRLNTVYSMAEVIASSLYEYFRSHAPSQFICMAE